MSINQPYQITILHSQIELKRDKNGKTYFTIHDQDTGITYFVFHGQAKGWYELITKHPKAQEIHLQFGNDKKIVIGLKILTKKEVREREREREKYKLNSGYGITLP